MNEQDRLGDPRTGGAATRRSFGRHPIPQSRMIPPPPRTYSDDECQALRRDLVPPDMDDRWFVLVEDRAPDEDDTQPWLYVHRRWTGHGVFAARFQPDALVARTGRAWRIVEALVQTDRSYMPGPLADEVEPGSPGWYAVGEEDRRAGYGDPQLP